jgi:hypothetical protein
MSPIQWKVFGGESTHIVNTIDGEYDCDCGMGQPYCSHELRVMMEMEPVRFEFHNTLPNPKSRRSRYKARLEKNITKVKETPVLLKINVSALDDLL